MIHIRVPTLKKTKGHCKLKDIPVQFWVCLRTRNCNARFRVENLFPRSTICRMAFTAQRQPTSCQSNLVETDKIIVLRVWFKIMCNRSSIATRQPSKSTVPTSRLWALHGLKIGRPPPLHNMSFPSKTPYFYHFFWMIIFPSRIFTPKAGITRLHVFSWPAWVITWATCCSHGSKLEKHTIWRFP